MTVDTHPAARPIVHVLVVEDEPQLLRTLTMNLAGRGYWVSAASTGAQALELVATGRPDLVVLDLGLPDMDGLQIIRSVRARGDELPIVVLSARAGNDDKVTALDVGASDYVTKPFDMNELVARLRAATRRADLDEPVAAIELGPVRVELVARSVRRRLPDGESTMIHLTATEWHLLEALLRRPGQLVTTTELLIAMGGDPDHVERGYLRIYLQQLRRKLEPDPSRPRYLLTEPGLGYRYQP
jgi:two-component system, OmpR family, KDP operon response regulator KdpE